MFFKTDWVGANGAFGDVGGGIPTHGACALAKSLAWALRHKLPLHEAVLTLLPDGKPPTLHVSMLMPKRKNWDGCLRRLYRDLVCGMELSDALDANLRGFLPVYFVVAVREAEKQGRLEEILPAFAERLNFSSRLGGVFRQRMFFPCIEFLAVSGIILSGLVYIAPIFVRIIAELFEEASATISRVRTVLCFVYWATATVLPALGVFWLLRRWATVPLTVALEHLPVLGGYCRQLALLDFYGCAASYLAAGEDIAAAAVHSCDACPSPWLKRHLRRFAADTQTGQPLADCLDKLPHSSELERWLLLNATTNGRLGEGFDTVQRLLSQKLSNSATLYAAVAEVLMLLFNALLVGTVALSMFAMLRTVIYHVGAQ